MKNNYSITLIRFIAIILVVLGHSIIIYDTNWGLYYSNISSPFLSFLKHNINLIQMPIYFAISGYLFYYSKNISYKNLISKKIKRLIIPFIIVSIFWLLPIRYFVKYPGYIKNSFLYNFIYNIILGKDNGHLWYLPTLFIIFLLLNIYKITDKKKHLKKSTDFLLIILLLIISYFGYIFPSYLGKAMTYIIYFYIGIILNKYQFKKKPINFTCFLLYLFIQVIAVYLIKNILLYKSISYMLSMILLYLLFNIKRIKYNKIIEDISKNSYGIYLFHSPLVYISYTYWPNINPIIMLLINFVLFGGLAYLITKILSKSKLKIILGM